MNTIIILEGGRGGVGKTHVAVNLTEWLDENKIEYDLADGDNENNGKPGCFTHYFKLSGKPVKQVHVRKKKELDGIIDSARKSSSPVTVVDLGAGAGEDVGKWIRDVNVEVFKEFNIRLVVVGVIGIQNGSMESVLKWGAMLGEKAKFVTVLNQKGIDEYDIERKSASDLFPYYFTSTAGQSYRTTFQPSEVIMPELVDYLAWELAELGARVSDVLSCQETIGKEIDLTSPLVRSRLKNYRTRVISSFDQAREVLLGA